MSIFSNLGKNKAYKELMEKYESEYKRITGCTTSEMKYPLIPDDDMYEEVKKLRSSIVEEAKKRGIADRFVHF